MTRETLEKGNQLLKDIQDASSLKTGLEYILEGAGDEHNVIICNSKGVGMYKSKISEPLCRDLLLTVNNHLECLEDRFKALKDAESEEVF